MLTFSSVLRTRDQSRNKLPRQYNPAHFRNFHSTHLSRATDGGDKSVTDAFATLFSELKKHTPAKKSTTTTEQDKQLSVPFRNDDEADEESDVDVGEQVYTTDESDVEFSALPETYFITNAEQDEQLAKSFAEDTIRRYGLSKTYTKALEDENIRTPADMARFLKDKDVFQMVDPLVAGGKDPNTLPKSVLDQLTDEEVKTLQSRYRRGIDFDEAQEREFGDRKDIDELKQEREDLLKLWDVVREEEAKLKKRPKDEEYLHEQIPFRLHLDANQKQEIVQVVKTLISQGKLPKHKFYSAIAELQDIYESVKEDEALSMLGSCSDSETETDSSDEEAYEDVDVPRSNTEAYVKTAMITEDELPFPNDMEIPEELIKVIPDEVDVAYANPDELDERLTVIESATLKLAAKENETKPFTEQEFDAFIDTEEEGDEEDEDENEEEEEDDDEEEDEFEDLLANVDQTDYARKNLINDLLSDEEAEIEQIEAYREKYKQEDLELAFPEKESLNPENVVQDIKKLLAVDQEAILSLQAGTQAQGLLRRSRLAREEEQSRKMLEQKWQEILTYGSIDERDVPKAKRTKPQEKNEISSELGKQIDDHVEKLFSELTPDEFDKVYNDNKVMNDRLKEKIQERLDQETYEGRSPVEVVLELIHSYDEEDANNPRLFYAEAQQQLESFVRYYKSLQDKYHRKLITMTPQEKRHHMLTLAFKKHVLTQQAQRMHNLTEVPFAQQRRSELDHLKDMNPRLYNKKRDELTMERNLPNEINDLLVAKALQGVSIAELKKYYESFKYPELKKASYEIDLYLKERDAILQNIENRQSVMRSLAGIKDGRRGRTPMITFRWNDEKLYHQYLKYKEYERNGSKGDTEPEFGEGQLPENEELEAAYIEQRERVDRFYGKQPFLTRAEQRDRRARATKRRVMNQRLDNTVKAIMFMRKYKGHALK
jgi:hypothetical protein